MNGSKYGSKIDINEIFPAEWYENVTNAANYVIKNIDIPDERLEDVVLHIIDYNISKQVESKLLDKAADDLPNYFSFVDVSSARLFNDFKEILDICSVCPSFKEHVIYFQIYDMEYDKRRLNFWKKIVKNDYPNLSITTRELKAQDCIKLVIRKICKE